ncbi:unnamed protein product [Didymodactylos carnosus]|uniref:RING-type domain-containing protein n=1 Tax=Didymodactylos carnosus TaxID=1234261 RepID=A0A814UAG0_9BILA|nr:unnamed protein product [Didymodactylos carnosus]CAF1632996.1 unnamed protein product [Didymodactylos carnosus]CAF3935944.1 unnamed protein product [Didymodactylos carnosus]CAF4461261.1 unnamed protein product [Didymodactylos carnosus]
MDNDWSRCPICFEEWNMIHRPTTFVCGHTVCIEHLTCREPLRECPMCRGRLPILKDHQTWHVSYALEEAARTFRRMKDATGNSAVETSTGKPMLKLANEIDTARERLIADDEAYARELERADKELVQLEQRRRKQSPNPHLTKQRTENAKGCGHSCDLITTRQCCACSDRRPVLPYYNAYVDGVGNVSRARRNEFYCPSCKVR